MNNPIHYIDRNSKELKEEKVYYGKVLNFIYKNRYGRWIGKFIANLPFISYLFGWWQRRGFTKNKTAKFVKHYQINSDEFEKAIEEYPSFDAFFSRKLKPGARPLSEGVIIPADGRYLCHQNVEQCEGFVVKDKKFSLLQLLKDESLAKKYCAGSMVIARLCPTDYHRFHFPCDCIPSESKLINGPLYSVNPIAIRDNINLLAENKRMITELETDRHGKALYIEIGATCVGSIHQTYQPFQKYKKGDEKGYFSFGGSSIILLFEPGSIKISEDLLEHSSKHRETLCLLGQPLGI